MTEGYKKAIQNFVALFIKGFERVCLICPLFRKYYEGLIYRSVVLKESKLAGIEKEEKVLHVGCGAMPFTSIALAKAGLNVVALDYDKTVVKKAQKLIKTLGYEDDIEFKVGDGNNFDYSEFKGVWVSLHVHPRNEIIKRATAQMPKGARLIAREPRNWLTLLYPKVELGCFSSSVQISRYRQSFGKETIIFFKNN